MNSRSRFLGVGLAALMLVAVAACGGDEDSGGSTGPDNPDAGADLRSLDGNVQGPDLGTEEDTGTGDQAVSGEVCDNFEDDDEDTLVDCDDPDCTGVAGCETEAELICDDGLDNDEDGRADCNDTEDCATKPSCQPTNPTDEVCDNESDDDNDGLVDCFDGDCSTDPACRPSTAEDCFNGIDDDGDLSVDCDDADCETACSGGGGGGGTGDPLECLMICFIDPEACLECLGGGGGGGGVETDCTNGLDDDGDSTTDCADFDCLIDPSCA